ncbi:MAG: rRNA methyltransferase [Gammaproteobacteria bacterium]|nr:MAG: rRNA methyltransferase [Gammaproteobacteria bacterium]
MNPTTDIPWQLLFQKAQQVTRAILWLADESFPQQQPAISNFHQHRVITNRYDVYANLKQHIAVAFSDFKHSDFTAADNTVIYYRVSKEKALTHYLINQAYQHLPLGGELHLAGYKGDGIKTYSDKAKKLFGETLDYENGANTAKYLSLKKTTTGNPLLDDKHYNSIQEIDAINGIPVQSKPGVFGWNKKDPGSQFLIACLGEFLAQVKHPIHKVLDLGCGYGYIALHAANHERLQAATFTLTDNNAAAIECAQLNINHHGLNASVIADDCGSTIVERFDIILCNPPFHKGFDVNNDITSHFLANLKRLLSGNGKALVVVNQFVGIEKRAAQHFKWVNELARNKSFKLIVLSGPKTS